MTLSDKIHKQLCCKCGDTEIRVLEVEYVREAVNKILYDKLFLMNGEDMLKFLQQYFPKERENDLLKVAQSIQLNLLVPFLMRTRNLLGNELCE